MTIQKIEENRNSKQKIGFNANILETPQNFINHIFRGAHVSLRGAMAPLAPLWFAPCLWAERPGLTDRSVNQSGRPDF